MIKKIEKKESEKCVFSVYAEWELIDQIDAWSQMDDPSRPRNRSEMAVILLKMGLAAKQSQREKEGM